jgi:hypothetical protein
MQLPIQKFLNYKTYTINMQLQTVTNINRMNGHQILTIITCNLKRNNTTL